MANTYTDPILVKAKPHAAAEKQIGAADPNGRTDVINRVPLGLLANLKRLIASLGVDGITLDFTDLATITPTGASMAPPIRLTNSAAGSTAVGDVLAVSSQTAVLGDTQGSLQKFAVAQAVIANGNAGPFAASGVVTAKAQGGIAAGRYVRKSATTRAVEDAGAAVGATTSPPIGALGIALAAAGGGLVLIYLFQQAADASGLIVGSFTRDISVVSGSQAVTGVAFTPKVLLFLAAVSGAVGLMCIGLSDGAHHETVYDNNNSGAGTWAVDTSNCLLVNVGGGATYAGSVSSLDADGFTIAWTKAGAPTGTLTVLFLAIR